MTRDELAALIRMIMQDMNLTRGIGTDSEIETHLLADALTEALRPALSAELHNSIMNGELELTPGETSYHTAWNYACVHRWIDAQFGPMPEPPLAEVPFKIEESPSSRAREQI